jgi:hypothetical protein
MSYERAAGWWTSNATLPLETPEFITASKTGSAAIHFVCRTQLVDACIWGIRKQLTPKIDPALGSSVFLPTVCRISRRMARQRACLAAHLTFRTLLALDVLRVSVELTLGPKHSFT